MNRYLSLLLFIGFAWGQTDFDKLVLKDGTTYFGEYSKIEGKKVLFKPQGAFASQPVPVTLIQSLLLEDGTFVINLENKYNKLSSAEYEKLSEEEKDVYNENRRKIKLRQLKSCTTVGCFWFLGILVVSSNKKHSRSPAPIFTPPDALNL